MATRGEGTQSLLCAYLAGAVLIGPLGNTLFGLCWLEPVAALVMRESQSRKGSRAGMARAVARPAENETKDYANCVALTR